MSNFSFRDKFFRDDFILLYFGLLGLRGLNEEGSIKLGLGSNAIYSSRPTWLDGGGPRCLDSLMGGISSESVFGFL
jgi:hypothetical protein